MKIRVIDFETTGLPEDEVRAICEVGYTDLHGDMTIHGPVAHLVNPGHPIPPATRAVHHICDADVADAMSPTDAARVLMSGMEPGDMFAAHNIKFERAFFGGGEFPWVCTLQCARHLFPDAPSHANQVLRYWLGLDDYPDFDVALSMPPHRAGPDSYVTAFLLRHMLRTGTNAEGLVELTNSPVLLRTVTFGKYRGQKWTDVPPDYLHWVVKQDMDADVLHTARTLLAEGVAHD